ncbi:hypothetical protein AVEN_163753-1 [Araneus ventricosus]|uniref:Uncharacterized protein n=1 Tax=Araneus ventricosus TaxID=182803 RepID=A0A4Y1ZWW1_ARAVE|nr:hypothetical protein AVEN_163753-1 [Araneus ventricosus]
MKVYLEQFRRTQSTGTIALIQIKNANRQQPSNNNSNSTFGFSNTNRQQITNNDSSRTFNSAQLTGFPLALQTKLQTPSSHSEDVPPFSFLRLYTLVRMVVASHGIIQCILYVSPLLIEKSRK